MPNILRQKFEIVISSEGELHESDIAGAIREGLPKVLEKYQSLTKYYQETPKFSLKGVTLTKTTRIKDLFHLG